MEPCSPRMRTVEPRSITLWDVASRKLLATLQGHTDQINALAFSPDGTTLASGSGNIRIYSEDNTVRLWDVADRKQIAIRKVPGDGVWSVAFSPDGTILAWGAGAITLWDVASRRKIATLEGVTPVMFSPDGATLASAVEGGGGTIQAMGRGEPTRDHHFTRCIF